jgi:hypothetical protein
MSASALETRTARPVFVLALRAEPHVADPVRALRHALRRAVARPWLACHEHPRTPSRSCPAAEFEKFTDACANQRSAMFTGLDKFDSLLGPNEGLSPGLVEVDRQPFPPL